MHHDIALSLALVRLSADTSQSLSHVLQTVCPASVQMTTTFESIETFAKHYASRPANPIILFLDASLHTDEEVFQIFHTAYTVPILCTSAETVATDAAVQRLHLRFGANILFEPFREDSVRAVLERSRNKLAAVVFQHTADAMLTERTQTLFAAQSNTQSTTQLLLPTARGHWAVRLTEILYCEADGQNTHCYTTNAEGGVQKTLVFQMLADIEAMLPTHDFIRIHKSFIAHLRHIMAFAHNGKDGALTIANNRSVPVSRMYKKALLERLKSGKRSS